MFKLKTNGIGHIFSKLNIAEQAEIRKYIGQEVTRMIVKNQGELEKAATEKEKYLTELNDKTWQRIETFLHMSMREHKISEERIKRIDKRILELSQELNGDKLLLGEERKSEYKILEDADFQKLFELLAYKYCNTCSSRNSNCEVYPLMKKYGIPQTNEGFKCKYAYKRKLKMSCER